MSKINKALTTWSVKKDVQEFIKERLGIQKKGGKNNAEQIIDNAIERAKIEEKPEWTNLLLNNIKEDKVKETSNTQNVFNIAASVTDDTLNKLVNVTPVKKEKKIEELI